MILKDFDPVDHSLTELVSFCERLELTEPELEKKSFSSGKKRKVGFQRDRNTNLKEDCFLLGKDCGHSTDELRTMKRHAEAVKKKYSNNAGHIHLNRKVQTIFNEAFMNFMDNKKVRKGLKCKIVQNAVPRNSKTLKNSNWMSPLATNQTVRCSVLILIPVMMTRLEKLVQ